MTSLRERKKRETRNKILNTSKKLFVSEGFEGVSMEMIAKEAEVGTGTLYNYYKNKSEVFFEAIQDSFVFNPNKDVMDYNINDTLQYSGKIVMEFIGVYVENIKWVFSKRLARELINALVSFSRKKNNILERLIQEDFKFIDNIEQLINKMIDANIIDKKNNARVLAELTYSAFMYEFMIYLYIDDISQKEMIDKLEEKVHTIFQDK